MITMLIVCRKEGADGVATAATKAEDPSHEQQVLLQSTVEQRARQTQRAVGE